MDFRRALPGRPGVKDEPAGPGAVGACPGSPYRAGVAVRHRAWGCGRVLRADDDQIVVLFDTVGVKTLPATPGGGQDPLSLVTARR